MSVPQLLIEVCRPRFRFLWLKYVVAGRLDVHCARCLVGRYSSHLPYRIERRPTTYRIALDEHPWKFVYLCGNTGVWADNVHVALAKSPGGAVTFENTDIRVDAPGVRQVEIKPLDLETGLGDEFTTCRNYQFAWWHLGGRERWIRTRTSRRRMVAQSMLF